MAPIIWVALAAVGGYVIYKRIHKYDTPLGKGSPVTVTTTDGKTQTMPYVLDAKMSDFQKTEFAALYDSLGTMAVPGAIGVGRPAAANYQDQGFPIAAKLIIDALLRLDPEFQGLSPFRVGPSGAVAYDQPEEGTAIIIDPDKFGNVPQDWITSYGGLQFSPGTPILLGSVTADGQWGIAVVAFPPSAENPQGAMDGFYVRVNDLVFGI